MIVINIPRFSPHLSQVPESNSEVTEKQSSQTPRGYSQSASINHNRQVQMMILGTAHSHHGRGYLRATAHQRCTIRSVIALSRSPTREIPINGYHIENGNLTRNCWLVAHNKQNQHTKCLRWCDHLEVRCRRVNKGIQWYRPASEKSFSAHLQKGCKAQRSGIDPKMI